MKKDKYLKFASFYFKLSTVIFILFSTLSCYHNSKVEKAFKHIEKGLEKSKQTFSLSNDSLRTILINNGNYDQSIQEIDNISRAFNRLIDSTVNVLIIQSGGWKITANKKELANPRNMNVSTQILVNDRVGDKIENLISTTSFKYQEILEKHKVSDTIQIPLKLNLSHIKESGKSWSEYTFNQLPLYAVLPILRKFKADDYESKNIIFSALIDKE